MPMPPFNWLNEQASPRNVVPYLNVRSYGAVGNGAANDTTAIQKAIDATQAAGGVVFLPRRTYKITTTLEVTGSVTLVGEGDAGWPSTYRSDLPPTRLLWAGADDDDGDMLRFVSPPWGGVRGIALDGGGLATCGLDLDRTEFCHFADISIANLRPVSTALRMRVSGTTANDGCQFNVFTNVFLYADTVLLMQGNGVGGAHGNANCCHNAFYGLRAVIGTGNAADAVMYLDDCDNNSFFQTYLFRIAGSGYGVDLAPRARHNYFYHLQASAGGLRAQTPLIAGNKNVIFGYGTGNGEPEPVLQTGAALDRFA